MFVYIFWKGGINMRYLACVKPAGEVLDYIERLGILDPPSSGLHLTLWGFNIDQSKEIRLIEALGNIRRSPFAIYSGKFKKFGDLFTGLRTGLSFSGNGAYSLHREVIGIVRDFDKKPERFDEMVQRYGLNNYSAHITVAKGDVKMPKDPRGLEMEVSSFYLLKKDLVWKDFAEFRLGT